MIFVWNQKWTKTAVNVHKNMQGLCYWGLRAILIAFQAVLVHFFSNKNHGGGPPMIFVWNQKWTKTAISCHKNIQGLCYWGLRAIFIAFQAVLVHFFLQTKIMGGPPPWFLFEKKKTVGNGHKNIQGLCYWGLRAIFIAFPAVLGHFWESVPKALAACNWGEMKLKVRCRIQS